MTALPEWTQEKEGHPLQSWRCVCGRIASMEHSFGGFCHARITIERYKEALAIAWKALEQANHWQNVKGLSPMTALDQVDIDLRSAMRRIAELGKE